MRKRFRRHVHKITQRHVLVRRRAVVVHYHAHPVCTPAESLAARKCYSLFHLKPEPGSERNRLEQVVAICNHVDLFPYLGQCSDASQHPMSHKRRRHAVQEAMPVEKIILCSGIVKAGRQGLVVVENNIAFKEARLHIPKVGNFLNMTPLRGRDLEQAQRLVGIARRDAVDRRLVDTIVGGVGAPVRTAGGYIDTSPHARLDIVLRAYSDGRAAPKGHGRGDGHDKRRHHAVFALHSHPPRQHSTHRIRNLAKVTGISDHLRVEEPPHAHAMDGGASYGRQLAPRVWGWTDGFGGGAGVGS